MNCLKCSSNRLDGICNPSKLPTLAIAVIAESSKLLMPLPFIIFVAFAPKENPKIAIAVFVEHGYWGGRWAAPMASLMIEKYLKGSITRVDLETKMLEGSLQEEYDKYISGEPFEINK